MGDLIEIGVTGLGPQFPGFEEVAHRLQSCVRFRRGETQWPPCVRITRSEVARPFSVDWRHGVEVSTWQIEGLCGYSGLEPEVYLLLCALLGITQWRVLDLNPLLLEEDLGHRLKDNCLFSRTTAKQDFAPILERPGVCPGCAAFYRCLGAEREIQAVQQVLQLLQGTG